MMLWCSSSTLPDVVLWFHGVIIKTYFFTRVCWMFLCHVYSSHRESTIICINSIQMLVFVDNLAVLNIPSYDKHVILAEDLFEYAGMNGKWTACYQALFYSEHSKPFQYIREQLGVSYSSADRSRRGSNHQPTIVDGSIFRLVGDLLYHLSCCLSQITLCHLKAVHPQLYFVFSTVC